MAPVAGLLFLLLLFLEGIALIGAGTFVLLASRLRASAANQRIKKPVAVLAGGVIALGAVVCLIPAFVLGMIRTVNQDGYIETHQSAYRYNFGAGQSHVTYIEYDGVRYYDLELELRKATGDDYRTDRSLLELGEPVANLRDGATKDWVLYRLVMDVLFGRGGSSKELLYPVKNEGAGDFYCVRGLYCAESRLEQVIVQFQEDPASERFPQNVCRKQKSPS